MKISHTALLLPLLTLLLASAPLSTQPLPLKTGSMQLTASLDQQNHLNMFQVPENYEIGDRLAFNVDLFRGMSSPSFALNESVSWELKWVQNKNQVTLEATTISQPTQIKVHLSYILISRALNEKVIFLQNIKLGETTSIKHLANNLLLTTSKLAKLVSETRSMASPREVFLLHRGVTLKENGLQAIMKMEGVFVNSEHIHIHTEFNTITTCFITLMIIDHTQLSLHQLQINSPLDSSFVNSFTSTNQISIENCAAVLIRESVGKCWEGNTIKKQIQFTRIHKEIAPLQLNDYIAEEDDNDPQKVLFGRSRLLSGCHPSWCVCIGYPHATRCFQNSQCRCKIQICAAGYYKTSDLASECLACPSNLTQCTSCGLQFGTTKVVCSTCNAGYVPLNGVCSACPVGCATCTTILVGSVNTVTCSTCVSTLQLKTSGSISVCGCNSNQVLNTAVSPVACVTCPANCLSCTSSTVCVDCTIGYYVSASSCSACMPVCKACASAGSCSTCYNTATLVGGVCTCPAPSFFDVVTKNCLSCSTLQPHCANCVYNGAYSASAPPTVVCSVASSGYYVNGNGSTTACVANCLNCDSTPAPICSTCASTFTFDGTSSCICTGGLYYSTTTVSCLSCGTVIPGCTSCQTNAIPTATQCLSCNPTGYFAAAYPSLTCTACPSLCTTCSSLTVCTGCINNLVILSGMCGCDGNSSLFLDSATQSCTLCSTAIFDCQICVSGASGLTCGTCIPGTYAVGGNTACYPCPSTCSACSSATVCSGCESGYTLSNGTCVCSTNCLQCLGNSTNSCSSCTYAPFTCTSCAVGYYSNLGSCTTCTSVFGNCAQCTNATCLSCASPFVLDPTGCVCNNTAGLYLSIAMTTCQACSTVIPNCQTCSNTGSTTCSTCQPGFYSATTQLCSACAGNCLTCSSTSTHCLTCLVTYSMVSANTCDCDNSASLYYDPATTGCSLCSIVVSNCQSCSTTGLVTTCTLCSGTYFWNNGSSSCDICSSSCATCSSLNVCTSCYNNLVLSETVAGYTTSGLCVCDNSTLPLTYYDSSSGTCQLCSYFYTTCSACFVSNTTVLCSNSSGPTYIVNSTTVNCPSPCSTCDQTGCLSCPSGMTLTNGSCICGSTCTLCQTLSVGCTSCTTVGGVISSCSSCLPGTFLSSPNCISCPATCDTCTSLTNCITCQPTYTLTSGICACATTLGIFPNSAGSCATCSSIFYGCDECQMINGTTACVTCASGYFVQGGTCSVCNSTCLTCSGNANTCTSCAVGQTLTAGVCTCSSASCLACSAISPNCATCTYTIYGNFSKCSACMPDYYVNGANCSPCPSSCQSCGAGGACLSCANTFEVIGGSCVCNSAKGMWESAGSCVLCTSLYSNCQTCALNLSSAVNVSCTQCLSSYYLLNGTCTASVCGDGIITNGEVCDDNNTVNGDGCSSFCQVESSFSCSGQPSICLVSVNYFITLQTIETSPTVCNQFSIRFSLSPIYTSYDSANFLNLLSYVSEGSISLVSWAYASGAVTYTFDYFATIDQQTVTFYFAPGALGVPETATIPIIVVNVVMASTNNIKLVYYNEDICKTKANLQAATKVVQYASYSTLLISALPCKIVGLQLFGVLQLAHINVGNMDNVNTMMTPLMGLKGVHGFTADLGKQKSKSRLLQAVGYTPSRVESIGYQSNFLRNCNVMLLLVVGVILVSLCLYLCTYCFQKCAPCLHSISKRIIKEVLLTLILFNCFNFAYSAGIHFNYAPKDDSLYDAGTAAAILALIVPILMAIGLMCAEDQGFGQYKEKFKPGLVDRLYFVITILYRTGIGLYISTANEDAMSTLIVMALSIAFLLYNLVNLPYAKAYHNYRANVCHFTQCICLFVAMYYRSMMSSTDSTNMAVVNQPVYLEMFAILLSLIVSVVVLAYEIYLFVVECQNPKRGNAVTKISDDSSHAMDKNITDNNLGSFVDDRKFSGSDDLQQYL